jgi:long-chain fatty acid transport protein
MLLALLLTATADAGGFYYSDSGIVALGRGGAWVAGADTQFAQEYNPAGLVRIERPTVNAGLSQVQKHVSFERQRAGGGFYDPAQNQAAPFLVPQLGFATPLPHDLAFAFGFYSPYAPSSEYSPSGPQRYSIIDSGVYKFSVGPSMAWRPAPWIAIGAGINWQYFQAGQDVKITASGLDNPEGDIGVGIRAKDPLTFGWNAGLLIEPIPQLSFGASVTPPASYVGRGTATIDFRGSNLAVLLEDDAYVYRDDVLLNIELPWNWRFGVAGRPVRGLEIEFALCHQTWSSLEDIEVTDIDVTLKSPLLELTGDDTLTNKLALPAGLSNVWSYRLGVEWRAIDPLEVRVGGFYEPGSVPARKLTVALMDPDKWQLGLGASVFALDERLRFDAGFAWLFFPDLKIRDSTATQIDAGVLPDVQPAVVGNGDISASGWILGLQAQVGFGKKKEDG